MTHAERLQEQKERVVSAAKVHFHIRMAACGDEDEFIRRGGPDSWNTLESALSVLVALERETCPECGGTGRGDMSGSKHVGYQLRCPAGCDQGRKRT